MSDLIDAKIGNFVAETAKLEFEIDRFVMAYAELKTPLLKNYSSPPKKFLDKVNFYVLAYLEYRPLRSLGDADLKSGLVGICYGCEEIWSWRNDLIHGRTQTTWLDENDNFRIEQTRFRFRKRTYVEEITTVIDSRFMQHLIVRSSYIRAMLRAAIRSVEGVDIGRQGEKSYQDDKISADLRAWLATVGLDFETLFKKQKVTA